MSHKSRVKKFIFSLAMAVGLALGIAAVCSFADRYTDNQGVIYEYDPDADTASVVGITNDRDDITIQSAITIDGTDYSVKTIGQGAFRVCRSLTSITIPSSVTSIVREAFRECSSLTSITIPEGVSLGSDIFKFCDALTDIYMISKQGSSIPIPYDFPNTVRIWRYRTINNTIGYIGAYDNKDQFINITIPSQVGGYKVTTISQGAFQGCTNLISITIPMGVMWIEQSAFKDCSNLTSITVPSSVTSIGSNAFQSCGDLTSITIPCKFDKNKFAGTGITVIENSDNFNIGTTQGTFTYSHNIREESIQYIMAYDGSLFKASGTCKNCGKRVEETATITSEVKTPPTCTTMGTHTYIGTFKNEGFETQTVDVEDIPMKAHTLSEVTGHTWTKSGEVWEYREGRICSVCGQVPEGVVTDVFVPVNYDYSNDNIPATTRIWKYSVAASGKATITGTDHNDQFVNVEIPARIGGNEEGSYAVTKIGKEAFYDCSSLTSITIPSSVTSIGQGAFWGCENLTSVMFQDTQENPSQLSTIEGEAFRKCSSLTSIKIPCNFDKSKFNDTGITVLDDDNFSNGTKDGTFTYTHSYGAPTYTWTVNENTATCTATRVCVNCNSRMEGLGPVTVAGYSGEYDENPHGITVTGEIPGATILYSEDGTDWVTIPPTRTTAGTTTVHVKVHGEGNQGESEEVQVTIKIIGPGDVNGDGFINIFDLQKLYNHVAGVSELNNEQEHRAELDGNGIINSGDLQSLFNIIVAS